MQEQIKSLLTGLMLSTPPLVRAQLSEALSVVSSHDFPRKWATLLPELIERLKTGDAGTVHGSRSPSLVCFRSTCPSACTAVAALLACGYDSHAAGPCCC